LELQKNINLKRYIGSLLFLFLTGVCIAQSNQDKEVQESVKQFFAALASKDSVAMKRWATADLTLIEYGTVWNMDTVIRKGIVQNTAADYQRADQFEFLSTTVTGKMALVSYRLTSHITANGRKSKAQWIESMNLLYEDNRWKVKFLHSTLLNRNSL
jgi:ketosteroid isomerase-like protein